MDDAGKTREELIGELREFRERLRLLEVVRADDTADELVRIQRDLALRLADSQSFHDTLRLCVEAARGVAGMDAGGVYVRDRSGALQLVFSDGLSDEFLRRVSCFPADSESARLVLRGEPIHVDYQQLRGSLDDAVIKEGLRATSIFPILQEREVVGCLNVASRTLGKLPPSRLQALNTIVSQVGNAIARARAEEALKTSERQLRQAQSLARLGSWRLDPRTGSIEGSDVLHEIFEVDRTHTDSVSFLAAVHPEDREYVLAQVLRGLEQGEAWNIEHRLFCISKKVNGRGGAWCSSSGHGFTAALNLQPDTTRHLATDSSRRIAADKERKATCLSRRMPRVDMMSLDVPTAICSRSHRT